MGLAKGDLSRRVGIAHEHSSVPIEVLSGQCPPAKVGGGHFLRVPHIDKT